MRKQDIIIEKYWFVHYPFECLDGWLPLIDSMCQEIQEVIKKSCQEFRNLEFPFEFSQIKEKYGRLVSYPSFANKAIWDIIDKYEEESITVCEICGMKGKLRGDLPWIQTLCSKCFKDKRKQYKNLKVNNCCIDCGKEITKRAKRCRSCATKYSLQNPSEKQIEHLKNWQRAGTIATAKKSTTKKKINFSIIKSKPIPSFL